MLTVKKVEKYNEIVKIVADTEGASFLPLHECFDDYYKKNNAQSHIPFSKTRNATFQAAVLNVILGWDWDKITRFQKHLATFDNLHFNSVGGKMISDLLVKHISSKK